MLKRISILLVMGSLMASCGGVDPESPLAKRKALFKDMLNTSEDLGGMLRGRIRFDEQRFMEKAQHLDNISRQPWQHFPQTKDNSKSSAKDDVWQKREHFMALARELENTTARLVESTVQKPLNTDILAVRMDLVEKACEGCHKEFRAY